MTYGQLQRCDAVTDENGLGAIKGTPAVERGRNVIESTATAGGLKQQNRGIRHTVMIEITAHRFTKELHHGLRSCAGDGLDCHLTIVESIGFPLDEVGCVARSLSMNRS